MDVRWMAVSCTYTWSGMPAPVLLNRQGAWGSGAHLGTEPVRPHGALALDVLITRPAIDMGFQSGILLHDQLCCSAGHLDAIGLRCALHSGGSVHGVPKEAVSRIHVADNRGHHLQQAIHLHDQRKTVLT